jgi:hypothetical protein
MMTAAAIPDEPAAVVVLLRWIGDEVRAGRGLQRWPPACAFRSEALHGFPHLGGMVLVQAIVRTALRAGNEATVALQELVGQIDDDNTEDDLAWRLAIRLGFVREESEGDEEAAFPPPAPAPPPAADLAEVNGPAQAQNPVAAAALPAGWLAQPRRQSALQYVGLFALMTAFVVASGRLMA